MSEQKGRDGGAPSLSDYLTFRQLHTALRQAATEAAPLDTVLCPGADPRPPQVFKTARCYVIYGLDTSLSATGMPHLTPDATDRLCQCIRHLPSGTRQLVVRARKPAASEAADAGVEQPQQLLAALDTAAGAAIMKEITDLRARVQAAGHRLESVVLGLAFPAEPAFLDLPETPGLLLWYHGDADGPTGPNTLTLKYIDQLSVRATAPFRAQQQRSFKSTARQVAGLACLSQVYSLTLNKLKGIACAELAQLTCMKTLNADELYVHARTFRALLSLPALQRIKVDRVDLVDGLLEEQVPGEQLPEPFPEINLMEDLQQETSFTITHIKCEKFNLLGAVNDDVRGLLTSRLPALVELYTGTATPGEVALALQGHQNLQELQLYRYRGAPDSMNPTNWPAGMLSSMAELRYVGLMFAFEDADAVQAEIASCTKLTDSNVHDIHEL